MFWLLEANTGTFWFTSPDGMIAIMVLVIFGLGWPFVVGALFSWKTFRKQFPLLPKYELFAFSEPLCSPEIARLFPLAVKVKKIHIAQDLKQVAIAKLETPFYWEDGGVTVSYAVLTAYVPGHHIEKFEGSLILNVSFVTDDTIVKDYFPSYNKHKHAVVCWGKEVGFRTEKNNAEGMRFTYKYNRFVDGHGRGYGTIHGKALILRQLPNLEDENHYYWLAKCDEPILLDDGKPPVTHLIVSNAMLGDRLKRGFDEMTLDIRYVRDMSTLNDLDVKLEKCEYATDCIVKFDREVVEFEKSK